MGDSQLRIGEGQHGDPWRRGGRFVGQLTCAIIATRFGFGRVGVVVASQLCGQFFGELASQIPGLFPRQPRRRGPGQPAIAGPGQQGPRRRQPRRPGTPQRPQGPLTPQELFVLRQQGFDPIGQLPGIPSPQPTGAVPGQVAIPPGLGQTFLTPGPQGPFAVPGQQGPGGITQLGGAPTGQGAPTFPGQAPPFVPGQPTPGIGGQPGMTPVGQPPGTTPTGQDPGGPIGQPPSGLGPPGGGFGPGDTGVIGGIGVGL